MRATALVEAFERLAGARPGSRFQVDLRGTGGLEDTIRRAARRVSLAVVSGAGITASGFTAGSSQVGTWLPALFGAGGGALLLVLLADLFWRRR